MKHIFSFAALMTGMLITASCTQDDGMEENQGTFQISIGKNADFAVYSGGRDLVKSHKAKRANDAGTQDLWFFKKADCPDLYKENFPIQKLEKEECEHVYACIKEDAASQAAGTGRVYEVDKSSFAYNDFYIVNAYSSKDHDAKGNHSDVAGDMHDLGMNGVYIKEFNTNTCVAADFITTTDGLKDVTYDDSFGVKGKTYTVSEWKLFYIPGDEYGYYIGMDYGSEKFGTPTDGDYSDWVIKLIPAKKSQQEVNETNGEVEVNLSVNDEHSTGDYIATKLSVHVRALTDVEVLIPVDKAFYCEADDMNISLSHRELNVVYNTEPQYVEMQIGSTTVTFTVTYEDEGIRITTDGVCKEAIDYCAEHYADGITFEVWNYFKNITREDLKGILDQSTVTFLDNNPKVYVNAFAKILDCTYAPIYNKFNENGQLVPYTDPECTVPLDQKYWTRETPDNKDYIFVGIQNPWDCTVTPTDPTYQKTEKDYSDATLPNYNVEYSL